MTYLKLLELWNNNDWMTEEQFKKAFKKCDISNEEKEWKKRQEAK